VKVLLHDYEINTHGVGAKLRTREERKKFLENKLYEMMKLCPWLDGYVMTTSESSRPAVGAEDIKAYVMGAWAGIKRANDEDGKKRVLMVRSWLSAGGRILRITEFFPFSTDKEAAKNIYIITKQQHGDFNMRLPINPLLGKVGDHPQIVAFDVTVNEYRAYAWYPCGMAHEWSARFRELVKVPGLVGLNPHIRNVAELEKKTGGFKNRGQIREWRDEDVKWTPWNHLNVYTFYALADDPFKDPRQIYLNWATKVYGAPAAKPLADILTMSSDVMFAAVGPSHSGYPPARSRYYYSPLEIFLLSKRSMHGGVFTNFDHNVTAKMIAGRQAPIDNAIKICDRMIEILETNKSKFKPDDYKRIHADLIGYRKYTEVKKICEIGSLRYVYSLQLKGSLKQEQFDAIEKLVNRGLELYKSPGNFFYKTGYTGKKSYIHTVRELESAVKAERSGKPVRIFPEQIAESLKSLVYRPDGIAHIGDHLYILGENKIHKLSLKGEQLAVSTALPFEARALSNDGEGGLLICGPNAVYRLNATEIETGKPVKWKSLPTSLRQPDAIAYDPQTKCLFVGDNKTRKIVQINPEGKIIATVKVPNFKEHRSRTTRKKIRGLTFHKGCLYAVESYAEPPFFEGTRWVYKLRKYKPVTKSARQPALVAEDAWHLAMGRRPYGLGLVEDVCFDASGNAWVISPIKPLANRIYRVELQK